MEEILYVKIAQNIPVAKRQVTFHDLATLHCTNKKVVQELNQMVFYTLPAHGPQKTMFTIAKVYEVIHQKYPNLKIWANVILLLIMKSRMKRRNRKSGNMYGLFLFLLSFLWEQLLPL